MTEANRNKKMANLELMRPHRRRCDEEIISYLLNKSIGNYTYSSGQNYHLFYLRQGTLTVKSNNQEIEVNPGNIFLVIPKVDYIVEVKEGEVEFILLTFTIKQIKRYFHGDANQKTLEDYVPMKVGRRPDFANINLLPVLFQDKIGNMIDCLSKEGDRHAYSFSLMQQCYFVQIMIMVFRSFKSAWKRHEQAKSGDPAELVRLARRYIIENYSSPLSIRSIANHIFLSTGYFTRVFREETGLNPTAFITQVRVAKACKLLEDKNIKVNSIAHTVGFGSPQRMNSVFRQQMGMTPNCYRKTFLANQAEVKQASRFNFFPDNHVNFNNVINLSSGGEHKPEGQESFNKEP